LKLWDRSLKYVSSFDRGSLQLLGKEINSGPTFCAIFPFIFYSFALWESLFKSYFTLLNSLSGKIIHRYFSFVAGSKTRGITPIADNSNATHDILAVKLKENTG